MRAYLLVLIPLLAIDHASFGQVAKTTDAAAMAAALKELGKKLAEDPRRDELRQMLGKSLHEQIAAANRKSTEEWAKIETREDWERFCSQKLKALLESLGTLPDRPARPRLLVTGKLAGDGFRIHNLVFESRPGLVVTANLYVPDPPRESMPGILLSHSHHNPKHEGELQDMGMTWARAGCYVLVPDHLGHGERRQHPFVTAADYAGQFQVGRQDYYFRYDTSLQLYLVGESLMGWMVHDLMTGVDVLLSQPAIDPKRIILLGSVAGGGDPAAVTAALDERIACLVPFNFGGPQPENRYPLPDDAETSFNYAGGGSWESTRNLRNSARDGFLPWVIVGSVAPRRLIHAHEFSWDRERDPVWKRYEKIWSLYGAKDNLAFTTGFGTIQNTSAPASHCNNIGPEHRKRIHEAFRHWFGIEIKPESEYKNRRTREELTCLTDEARKEFQPKLLHELLSAKVSQQLAVTRSALKKMSTAERRQWIVKGWTDRWGESPREDWRMKSEPLADLGEGGFLQSRQIAVHRGAKLPDAGPNALAVTLVCKKDRERKCPLVIAIAADGATGFLTHRASQIAQLLHHGAAVALVDVTGTGRLAPGDGHGQNSSETSHSATEMMLGSSLLSTQLRDLRALMGALRTTAFVDNRRIYLWGVSFAEPLEADGPFHYPRRVDRPAECTPTGPLLALLWALTDDSVAGVYAQNALVSNASVLESSFVQVPHASFVPGVLQFGDLPDLLANLAPLPIVLEGVVDGRNARRPTDLVSEEYQAARTAYSAQKAATKLTLRDSSSNADAILAVLQWENPRPPQPLILPPK